MSAPSLLIVRFSAIGDCVMAAWAATSYRNRYPDGKLVWAVERRCRAMVDEEQLVTSVAEFPRDRWKKNRWSPATWAEQLRAYAGLRKHHFDWGLDLQGHSKTALALLMANPKRRLAVDATDFLAKQFSPLAVTVSPTVVHTVERNHGALQAFGEFKLPMRPVMPGLAGAPRDPKLATISVGAGSIAKMWPIERWGAVANELKARGFEVTLLGGPDDPRIEVPGVQDCIDKLSLAETRNLVARSALHLAADTGTGHMAAAYGVPVVSIFGPSDDRRFRPYTQLGKVLRNGAETAEVSVDQVLAATDELVNRANEEIPCVS